MIKQATDGMTVNERLFHFGLFHQFDTAARSGDISAMVEILLRAQLSDVQALQTAQAVAENPKLYGY